MASVTWSTRSVEDLNEIYRFFLREAPQSADSILDDILSSVERLAAFPRSGRIVPERDQGDIREVIVREYRVMYTIAHEDVSIVTVIHGARRFEDPTPFIQDT